jgi:hypothetical protein
MPRHVLHLVFAFFTTAFVAIIAIANHGGGERLWGFLTDIPCGDKLGHLGLVGTLSFLLNLVLDGRRGHDRRGSLMSGSLILLVVMSLEEVSQAFLPHRSFDLLDGLANLIGVICGEGLVRMLPPRRLRSAPGH